MALDIVSILNAVVSHAMELGRFDVVNQFESKRAPSNGLTANIWVSSVTPIQSSGLAITSMRLELTIRIYSSTTQEPYSDIDAEITQTLDELFASYCGDFDLGGLVRHVDIFGAHGQPLLGRTGYINQDGKEFRVFSIILPLIVNDLWVQSP